MSNINLHAAYVHILTDIILSIGVIISALIIYFAAPKDGWSYWQLADPLCTYLFSIMAIYSTISIAKEAALLLLDASKEQDLHGTLENALTKLGEVAEIQLRVWSSNRKKTYATLKIVTNAPFETVKSLFEAKGIESIIQYKPLPQQTFESSELEQAH